MNFGLLRLSKHGYRWQTSLSSSAIEIIGEEYRDFITLQILLVAVQLFVIFEKIYIELKAAFLIVLVNQD